MVLPLVAVTVFVMASLATVTFLMHRSSAVEAQPPALPLCNETCHAQGLALIQQRIDTKVSALTRGHQCYPVDPPRLTKYVVVRSGETVYRTTFGVAFKANTDNVLSNNVWVLARCN